MALSTRTPTVDEIVQSDAPRARVNPVGAEPNFEMVERSEVTAAVPVPEVVPPADSIVSVIELSIKPVTVSVPDDVAASVRLEVARSVVTTASAEYLCI